MTLYAVVNIDQFLKKILDRVKVRETCMVSYLALSTKYTGQAIVTSLDSV